MKPIRVLQVFTVLNIGGAETNLMNYYRKLNPKEVQMDFLVHRNEGFFEKEILENGNRIFRLPPIHPASLTQYKKAVAMFFKEHAHEFDLIHGQLSELGIYIYKAAKKHGVPVRIAHAHNSKMDWDVKSPFRFLWKHQMRKYINGYFSCGHESSKWLFGNKLAKKAFIMPNSIDVQQFSPKTTELDDLKTRLNIQTPYSFLHIGRFATQKNHGFLIDVFEKIHQKIPEAKLFLVGLGELMESIRDKVKAKGLEKQVVFLERRSDVHHLMQVCNFFLFPSLFEGFSVALIEAQASGMHSFISDGIPQESILIPNNVSVLPLKNPASHWAKHITTHVLQHPERDNNAYMKIKEAGYDVNDNVHLLYKEYKRLLQTQQP